MSSRKARLYRTVDNFSHVGKILKGRKVYVFSPNLSPTDVEDYIPGATLFKKWEDVIAKLQSEVSHPPKVVVFSHSPMQIVQET